jgi:hypothetical protein
MGSFKNFLGNFLTYIAMQDTWNTYTAWEEARKGTTKDAEAGYQRALEMLNERLPYEQKIITIRHTRMCSSIFSLLDLSFES